MKKLLLIIALLLPLVSSSQTQISGVLGVTFGSSKAKVHEVMKAKGYKVSPHSKTGNSFSKVTFGAFKECDVAFKFNNNKLFEVIILLPEVLEAKLIDQYKKLVAELNQKYGKADSYKKFETPYEEGDGYETTAISLGKASYKSYWNGGKGIISAEIDPQMYVMVVYQDNTLVKDAIDSQNKKNASDY